MFGAIIGDMAGFPYEYRHEDLTDRDIPLFRRAASASSSASGEAQAGEDFSDKTVMTAAVEAGLLQFERILPSIFAKKPAERAAPEAGTPGRKAEENGTSAQSGSNAGGSISVGSTDGQGARIPQNAFEENYRKEVAAALRSFGQRYPLAGYAMDLSIWLFREGAGPVQTGDAGPAARVSPVALYDAAYGPGPGGTDTPEQGVRHSCRGGGLRGFPGHPRKHKALYLRLPGERIRI